MRAPYSTITTLLVLGVCLAFSAPSIGSDHRAVFVDEIGEWALTRVEIDNDEYLYTVDLDGTREFSMVAELRSDQVSLRLSVGGQLASCLVTDAGFGSSCNELFTLLGQPLLTGGVSIQELTELAVTSFEELLAQAVPGWWDSPDPACWNDEVCLGFGDCCCEAFMDGLGMPQCWCDYPQGNKADCTACCSELYPVPNPNSTDSLEMFFNCANEAKKNLCICECVSGPACDARSIWNAWKCFPTGWW